MKKVIKIKDMDIKNMYNPNNIEFNDKNINFEMYKLLDLEEDYLPSIFKKIYDIQLNGYIPIILYPEKLKSIVEDVNNINDFIDANCLFILDAKSLEGDYGSKIRKVSKIILKNRIYNFINKNRVAEEKIRNIISKYEGCSEVLEESFKNLINCDLVEFLGRRVNIRKKILGVF